LDRFNLDYVEMMLPRLEGVKSVLDVGSLDVNGTPRPVIAAAGLDYTGCDLTAGPGVDVVADITLGFAEIDRAFAGRRFDLVMSLNTLEHIFEPLKALDNMLALVRPGCFLLIVAPCVWEPHSWPYDYYRLLPDFFTRYAETRRLAVVESSMFLSTRDTRKFSPDVTAFPVELPVRAGGYFARKVRHFAKLLAAPGLKECWPHTSVNVTFRKPQN
jgi:SAM-dependent methyltransferase